MAKQIRTLQLVPSRIRSQADNAFRQEFVTRVIYTLASAGVVVLSGLVLALRLTGQADVGTIALTLVTDFVVIMGWLFIANRHWQASAALLPLVPLTVAGYMVYTAGPVTTGVMQLLLAVILAGMLSGNRARWVTVGLACLVYFGAGWASGGLDLETMLTSGSLLVVTLVVVALLERFFTDQLSRSQATVRAREVELESIFRAAPVGIGMVVNRIFTEANPTLCQMTGYAHEELIGNSSRMLYPTQEEYEYVGAEKYDQIGQFGQGTVETRWICKDGSIRDILLSSVPLDPSDLARGVTFSALDITERKRATQALHESEESYRQTVENSPNPIFSIDRQGKIRLWNRACEKTFHYGQSVLGQSYHMLLSGEADCFQVDQILAGLEYGQSSRNIDMVFRCKDGTDRYMVSRIYPFCNAQKVVQGYVFASTDVTERRQAEQALRQSEERYRLLFDEMLSGFALHEIICDPDGKPVDYRFLAVNRAFEQLTGLKADDLVGRTVLEALPGTEPFWIERYGRVALEGVADQFEGFVAPIRKYYEARAFCPEPGKFAVMFHDVTERRLAEQELRKSKLALQESQALYQDLVETAQDLIWQCDREGRYIYLNPAWEEVFGYPLDEMLGKPFIVFQPPEYAARDEKTFLHLLEGNSVAQYETVHLAKDGRELQLVFNAKAVRDSQGDVIGTRGTAYDITHRKRAERALQESAARYQAVVENQTEFIVRWKPGGTRTFVNEAYLRYFNLTMEEALTSGFLMLVSDEDRRMVEEKISRLSSGQAKSETDVHRVIRPDGSTGWQEWTDHAICNEHGEIVEFQSVGRDVTERVQAEEALRTKTAELEALFSISSHLRTAQSADAMLPVVLEEMRRVLSSDANAVILFEPDQAHFVCALSDGPLAVNTGGKFPVESSISGLVLQTGRLYLTEDLSSDPQRAPEVQGEDNLGPAVVVPVVSESEFLGVLLCARQKYGDSRQFSSSEVRLLTAIGEMVGNALRRARLYDQALKRMQHLQTLHSIDTAISANLDLGVILDVLLTQGMAQLDVQAACVMLLNPQTHMLEHAASKGFRTREIRSSRMRIGEGLAGQVALGRKGLHVSNLGTTNLVRRFILQEGFVSYQAAPLIAKGQLQGVLEIFNRGEMSIDEERNEFLETLAIQAAIAIDNSQLFSDLQRSNFELEMAYDATIEGWSRALELRDQETEGHTLRVTDMTVQLAQELGVPNQELIHIRRGALLHDIGKMGVPDRILLKPAKLTPQEWEIMKRHTVYAREMLWPIEFLRPAIDIPYFHHERWDGTGYPRQLKAEQIPLSARLFAVADVWDALTNNRPYRKAWTKRKALEHIRSNAGRHFDPQVVEIFLVLQNNRGKEIAFE